MFDHNCSYLEEICVGADVYYSEQNCHEDGDAEGCNDWNIDSEAKFVDDHIPRISWPGLVEVKGKNEDEECSDQDLKCHPNFS